MDAKKVTRVHVLRTEDSLKAAPLLQVGRGLCGDEADQLLHAVVLGEEEEQPTVLGLALLQDVILFHQLSQRHVLPVQQLVDVGGGVQVKLPKHGGRWDGGHSPGPLDGGVMREGRQKWRNTKVEEDEETQRGPAVARTMQERGRKG